MNILKFLLVFSVLLLTSTLFAYDDIISAVGQESISPDNNWFLDLNSTEINKLIYLQVKVFDLKNSNITVYKYKKHKHAQIPNGTEPYIYISVPVKVNAREAKIFWSKDSQEVTIEYVGMFSIGRRLKINLKNVSIELKQIPSSYYSKPPENFQNENTNKKPAGEQQIPSDKND